MANPVSSHARRRALAPLGYCTNVHAGADLRQTQANLARHALAVREQIAPTGAMGVGLWLSAATADELWSQPRQLDDFAHWLGATGLVPYTFNGFPYGDFHQPTVKHAVYLPTWLEAARREYTLNLVRILDRLLPPGEEGSISTLPLAWGAPAASEEFLASAAQEFLLVASQLERLEERTGRLIYLCLEPEPGCVLQRSDDVTRFFVEQLFARRSPEMVARYLRVCHDVCHHAVMFESPAEVLARYREAGISVGKMQISAAVRANLAQAGPADRQAVIEQLESFAEKRYLHQSVIRRGQKFDFHQDLDLALRDLQTASGASADEIRVHFHVPIYLGEFGHLSSTQDAICETLAALDENECHHFEVETYAWEVVPATLKQPELADGIAAELRWLMRQPFFSSRLGQQPA